MATIIVDGVASEVEEGQNLLAACLQLGYDLPYFCWHPAMGSIGACRQCAVKLYQDADDRQGRIAMACMTQVTDGARLAIRDPEAEAFRAAVIEWLMLSHPHDCPICDEGGECHLQDMTVMTGHTHRRSRFAKRTFCNQDLGPLINHEMNRCIQCYRCVRFYKDLAGGDDLQPFASRNRVWFGRFQPGKLENPFSGNLVEVCPTGVFTDKTSKQHYARKWDLQTAPSVCVHCSLGCNTLPGERYGLLRRILNRYHGRVNGYFLCDRGRFGYGFVNRTDRVRRPMLRAASNAEHRPVERDTAREHAARLLADPARLIGVGSPRASLEANYLLRRLVGAERFCNGMGVEQARLVARCLRIQREGPARGPSLREVQECDAVLVLGEDVANTAGLLALSLRQSVRKQPLEAVDRAKLSRWDDAAARLVVGERKGPLYIASAQPTWLDSVATRCIRAAPQDVARLGFAVAHQLDPRAQPPENLDSQAADLAAEIADALRSAKRPLVVSGTASGSEAVLMAAANAAWALGHAGREAALSFVLPECNSAGASLLEAAGLERALALSQNGADTLVVLENDLFRRADRPIIAKLLDAVEHVLVLDHLRSATAQRAELVLPAATFAEGSGTLVSNEGRAQRFVRVFPPGDEVADSWRWLLELGSAAGREDFSALGTLDAVVAAMADEVADLRGVASAMPDAGFRLAGQRVGRQSQRYSGRTAMQAHIQVSEPRLTEDADAPLAFSMEGHPGPVPAALIARYWAPGWSSVQAHNRVQETIGGALAGGDPGVRLIEPPPNADRPYFTPPPDGFQSRAGRLLLVPIHHLFGSEELSARSPPIAECTSEPTLFVHPADADAFGLGRSERLALELPSGPAELRIAWRSGLPRGVAGLSVGLPGQPFDALPVWWEVKRP